MMTITGEHVTLTEGVPSLEAMALGLSRTPRFAGQTLVEWTVADHLICLALYIHRMRGPTAGRLALLLLLHDAHEALTGDIPTTYKTPDMKKLQANLDERIFNALEVWRPSATEESEIKFFDEMALLSEAYMVCPRATYDKLVEHRGRLRNDIYCDVIAEWLHNDYDRKSEWLAAVTTLLNIYARRRVVAI